MPASIRALRPLLDFVDPVDTPLYPFLQFDQIAAGNPLDKILVSNAWTSRDETGFTLGAEFYLKGVSGLHLPGIDQIKLSLNGDDSATGILKVCGPNPLLTLNDLEIALEIDPAILNDGKGNPAKIESRCAVSFDESGFHFHRFSKASLNAFVGTTGVGISLKGVDLDPAPGGFLTIDEAEISLPMFADSAGAPLLLRGNALRFDRQGPSGTIRKNGGAPLKVRLYDFSCEIEDASLTLDKGQLVEADLKGRMDLSAFFADGKQDGWISTSFHIGPSGVSAALSLDGPIVELRIDDAFRLAVNTIRLAADRGADPVLWLSGTLRPEIDGVDGEWPEFEFDEIGITSSGELRLSEGASIATTQPFSVSWHFARLTVSSFTLQKPTSGASGDFELRLSAAVELLQGIPAGASVDGLVVTKRKNEPATVRFDGIGIHFGTPGGFEAAVNVAWNGVQKKFSGNGYLDIPALDLRLDVVFAASTDPSGTGITTVFMAAEMSLPGGIPIGTTGLSLYGVSGLLAYNKEINLAGHTGPRRYFERFNDPPQGYAAESKWIAREGANALGLGVVIGTGDDGWAFSCRGALLLTFPDIAILATATGDLLSKRAPMNGGEGKLSAVLAVLPAEQLMRFDFSVQWKEGALFEVEGSGGGEFYFERPLNWMVFAGKNPSEGRPISARALRMGDSFLLSTDYWFKIDAARSANIGMATGIDWRFGPNALHIELAARVWGNVTLAWSPAQLEGDFGVSGRARLAAGGLSLGLDVSSQPSLTIARPKELEIPLKACIEIDLRIKKFELCLAYTIAWVDRNASPTLETFVHGLSAVPRNWASRLTASPQAPQDSGIVSQILEGNNQINQIVHLGTIQPHSELVLEFSKSVAVALSGTLVKLNDVATPFPQAIGKKSGWAAAWTLTRLALRNTTDKVEADLFGTFSRSPIARQQNGNVVTPRPPNTELRLLSSRRFGQDGSLGGGGVDHSPSPDCTSRPAKVRRCIALSGLEAGFGALGNGWPYAWQFSSDSKHRSNRFGVRLGLEDRFRIFTAASVDAIYVTFANFDSESKPIPGTESQVRYPVPPEIVDFWTTDTMLVSLCWDELVVDSGAGPTQAWTGSSGTEEWTLADASSRLLVPNRNYELDIRAEAQLLERGKPRGLSVFTRTYTFSTAHAPHWESALANSLAGKYPDDGSRPVFRDYDLLVRFKDDFYEALYRLDRRTLGVRIRDANGKILHGPNGSVLLPTSWSDGSVTRSPNEDWWSKEQAGHATCEQATPPPAPTAKTVLPIPLKDLGLRPLERYTAEIIAVDSGGGDANPTEALAAWSFTTSMFKTYAELVAAPAYVSPRGYVRTGPPIIIETFDSLIRAFQAPVVTRVDRAQMTPVRANDRLGYVLLEAPEPLDDEFARLTIRVEGTAARLLFNLDRTRVIACLATALDLVDPQAYVAIEIEWLTKPPDAPAEAGRTMAGVSTLEKSRWLLPIGGVF